MITWFLVFLLMVVLPGAAFSVYHLFPEGAALDASTRSYRRLAESPLSTVRDLSVAEVVEKRHRINCFAERVGVLMGWIVVAIEIHGLCPLTRRST